MTTYYFDSSALVKYYIPETGSAWVSGLIDAQVEDGEWQNVIAIAKVGIVEVAAAAARRRRMKDISEKQQQRIVARFLGDCSETLQRYGLMTLPSNWPPTLPSDIRCVATMRFTWP